MRRDPTHERLVLLMASVVSVLAAAYFFRMDQAMLYGDAVAHINIARRVVDNITPGPFQLGTVWLPLPHLLMLPFVWIDALWINGLAGSLPSMAAYVIACVGMFRLLRLLSTRTAAWIGTLFFILNPNLIYMQSTAMTESIYLAAMIWAVYYLTEFDFRLREGLEGAGACLPRAAIALAAAILTRYDGWFFAGACAVPVAIRYWQASREQRRKLFRPVRKAVALCLLTATFWLAWNFWVFGNPLEFANGPYSAKSIAARTTPKGDPPYPGQDHPWTAAIYFLKSAKLNVAEGKLEPWIFGIALFGAGFTLFEKRRRIVLLLWVPLIFYSLSIAYQAVPIFIPPWWPFSYYNVRYGLQLLPAIAVFFAFATHYLRRVHLSRAYVHASTIVFVVIAALGYVSVWRHTPITLREARVNSVSRVAMEKQLARQLMFRASGEKLLMFTGEYSGLMQRAQIPFRAVINEGNFNHWRPALADPASAAEWVIASEGDEVSQAVALHPQGLTTVAILHTSGKKPVTIYRSSRKAQ